MSLRNACTSSRAAHSGLLRLAAADTEGPGTGGLAVTSAFLSLLGLSRESSTVASAREEDKPKWDHYMLDGHLYRVVTPATTKKVLYSPLLTF